jgi:hypothetical protein
MGLQRPTSGDVTVGFNGKGGHCGWNTAKVEPRKLRNSAMQSGAEGQITIFDPAILCRLDKRRLWLVCSKCARTHTFRRKATTGKRVGLNVSLDDARKCWETDQ